MRKALLSILLVLALILIFLFMKNGLSIGSFQIYGFQDIALKNDELTQSINKANQESDNYTSALSKLEQDVETLANDKKRYLDLIAQSTESEIINATQTKTYTIEYLWSRVGNHATAQGVRLKMEIASSTLGDQDYRNLNFTVDGEYLAIVQFVYDLENDANLDFTIDNYHMTSGQATFTVKDVKIIKEQSEASSSTNASDDGATSTDETTPTGATTSTEGTTANEGTTTDENNA